MQPFTEMCERNLRATPLVEAVKARMGGQKNMSYRAKDMAMAPLILMEFPLQKVLKSMTGARL